MSKTPGHIAKEAYIGLGCLIYEECSEWERAGQAVRKAAFEEMAKHLCPRCAKGKKIAFETYLGKYDHGTGPCHAAEIWMLLKGRPQ